LKWLKATKTLRLPESIQLAEYDACQDPFERGPDELLMKTATRNCLQGKIGAQYKEGKGMGYL
jgi:hypothetical protein